ncbi:nitrile hydratase accessory protein [Aurantimonas sp. A2-1-M11]|uniref:nitrile hydratase accessory protein n=1 Tax=Aurantimonas sp. A2-1-M11 TaxID=3113712 RepID=UPI002F937CE3
MSAPEQTLAAASPGLPRDEAGEPVFFEPWQAKAFAMTVALNERGILAWPDWAAALGRACAALPAGQTTPQAAADAYFTAWLAALEEVLATSGLVTAAAVDAAQTVWHRAAEATPHGTPIRYQAGLLPAKN